MASICEVCGKGIQAGCNVSHSNRHSKLVVTSAIPIDILNALGNRTFSK